METTTTLFDLSSDKLSELINSAKSKLKELGQTQLKLTFYRQLVYRDQTQKVGVVIVEGSAKKEKATEVSSELSKLFEPYGPDALEIQIEAGLGEGEKFPAVDNITDLSTKETKNFECPSGEVVLVDFWATWCGPCQQPMQHNQEMLEKNGEKWKGKARIVGISLDNKIDDVVKRVEDRKWQSIEHYHAPGGFKAPSAAQFGIRGIPCVFLVDKKGNIRFRGHPSSINLEDKINELIAEEDTVTPPVPEVKETAAPTCSIHGCSDAHATTTKAAPISFDTEIEAFKKFAESYEANKGLIEKIDGITAVLVGVRDIKSDEETFKGRIILAGSVRPQDKEAVLSFHNNVIKTASKDFVFENRLTVIDSPEVKYGTACATCKKPLSKDVSHYVCTGCQLEGKEDSAFCVECADKELTQEVNSGSELFHPHGLLFVHADSEESLKTLKRRLDRAFVIPDDHPMFAEVKAEKACGGVSCDSCGQGPIIGHRWACANCDNFDYCTECVRASRDSNHEKHAQVNEKGAGLGHDKSHVFYRGHFLMSMRGAEPKPFEIPN